LEVEGVEDGADVLNLGCAPSFGTKETQEIAHRDAINSSTGLQPLCRSANSEGYFHLALRLVAFHPIAWLLASRRRRAAGVDCVPPAAIRAL
jgi:hypothetical protein